MPADIEEPQVAPARVQELEVESWSRGNEACALEAKAASMEFDLQQARTLAAEMAEALGSLFQLVQVDDPIAEPGRPTMKRAEAALARYRAQAEGDSGWLPIESAPHGVEVLLYTPPFACMGASARHEMRVGCASWGDVVNGISNRGYDGHATHWRPLPPPPASEQEGRADDL